MQAQKAVGWVIKQEYFSQPLKYFPTPLTIIPGFSLPVSHSLHKREPQERGVNYTGTKPLQLSILNVSGVLHRKVLLGWATEAAFLGHLVQCCASQAPAGAVSPLLPSPFSINKHILEGLKNTKQPTLVGLPSDSVSPSPGVLALSAVVSDLSEAVVFFARFQDTFLLVHTLPHWLHFSVLLIFLALSKLMCPFTLRKFSSRPMIVKAIHLLVLIS